MLGATPHEFESRILRQCLTGHDVEGPHRSRWGPSTLSVSVSVSVGFRDLPQRVSDLLRGKIELFSLDALVNMLAKAGMRVELKVKQAA